MQTHWAVETVLILLHIFPFLYHHKHFHRLLFFVLCRRTFDSISKVCMIWLLIFEYLFDKYAFKCVGKTFMHCIVICIYNIDASSIECGVRFNIMTIFNCIFVVVVVCIVAKHFLHRFLLFFSRLWTRNTLL